ncbi:MAG TPA: glycosyltransferase [Phycisphaerales bacterium]
MKVVTLSTYDITGGAARCAQRHHEALRAAGVDHNLLVAWKRSSDPAILPVPPYRKAIAQGARAEFLQRLTIERNRAPGADTWFTFPFVDCGADGLSIVRDADVIEVHWCSGLVSLDGLDALFALGKPVVITLHDQWLFTGGCHYSGGCEGYLRDCATCPQLAHDPVGVPATVLSLRKQLGARRRGTVIGTSRWIHALARSSPVFAGWRHEHLPSALDLRVYRPRPRDEARREIDLDDAAWNVLFVADRFSEKRKGFDDLVAAARQIGTVAGRPVRFVAMGQPVELDPALADRVRFLGVQHDQARIAAIYAACDAMLIPSHEDNLPNTMLEALATGTPVVAYRVGGVPDMVHEGSTGALVERGDTAGLARALTNLLKGGASEAFRGNCRAIAEREVSYDVHAQRCLALFEDLLKTPRHEEKPLGTLDERLYQAAFQLALQKTAIKPGMNEAARRGASMARVELQQLFGQTHAGGWSWA